MSWPAMQHMRDHSAATGPTKSVGLMIAMRANEQEDHTCYPGIPRLAKDTGFSERTVKKAIRWLVKNEEIAILERGGFRGGVGYANRYQITFKFSEDYGHEVPVGNGHEVHIADDLQAPQSPLQAPGAPRNGHVSPLEGAPQTPQRKEKPQVVKPKEETKETPPGPPKGGEVLSPEYRDYLALCGVWLRPENSGGDGVEEAFHSLLAAGWKLEDLVAAFRGATESGITDLAAIFTADNIEAFKEADPIAQGWKKVAAA